MGIIFGEYKKTSFEMVAVLEISLAKFVTSIVTVSALIVALLLKLFPAVTLKLFNVRSASASCYNAFTKVSKTSKRMKLKSSVTLKL